MKLQSTAVVALTCMCSSQIKPGLVDSNPDLSNIEKFNYLSSLLENTAREAIAGLSLTDANYVEAVSTLKKRFGVTQQIIRPYLFDFLIHEYSSQKKWVGR